MMDKRGGQACAILSLVLIIISAITPALSLFLAVTGFLFSALSLLFVLYVMGSRVLQIPSYYFVYGILALIELSALAGLLSGALKAEQFMEISKLVLAFLAGHSFKSLA